jgi:hypothetical protein
MNVFKVLVTSMVLIFLIGCGSVDHDPPKLETNDLGEVSPFDTLQVKFDKDVSNFDEKTLSTSSDVKVLKVSGSSIFLVGDDTTISGLPVFKAGVARHTVTFEKIEDVDGNESDEQSVTFATYPILDNDGFSDGDCIDNGTPKAAEVLADSLTFFNKTDMDDGLTFAALLSGDYNDDCPDLYDYFRVYLRAKDTLFVKMSDNAVPLSVFIKGPKIMTGETGKEYQTVFEFNAASKKTSIDTAIVISADIHMYGTTDMKQYLAYYIQVSYPANASVDPVPYVLTVRRGQK